MDLSYGPEYEAFRDELRAPLVRDAVVPALPSAVRRFPASLNVPLSIQPMQHGVEHAIGPRHVPARELTHPLQEIGRAHV